MSSTALTGSYKAARVETPGAADKALQVKTLDPITAVPSGHALVKVAWVGINYIDIYYRNGTYPRKTPFTTGQEGSGVVQALSVDYSGDIKVGQHVGFLADDVCAEYVLLPVSRLVPLPSSHSIIGSITKKHSEVGLREAAALMLQGGTAVYLVKRGVYRVQSGDWILVTAASGGLGRLIVQLAKHVIGPKGGIIGTTSSPSKLAELQRQPGIDVALLSPSANASQEELDAYTETIKKATGGNPLRIVYDGVSGPTALAHIKALGPFGQFVSFGNAGGQLLPIDLNVGMGRNLGFHRVSLTAYTSNQHDLREFMAEVFEQYQKGHMELTIDREYTLDEIAQAHADLEGRKSHGKLLIRINPPN